MVSPELLAVGGVVATVLAAAGYSYFTGKEASVDVDDDGNDEVTFGGDDEHRLAGAEPKENEGDISDTLADVEAQSDPTPEAVAEKESLTDITGIGDTRAADLMAAGFTTPEDIYYASDNSLTDVEGIGPYTVEQIRGDIGRIGEAGNE